MLPMALSCVLTRLTDHDPQESGVPLAIDSLKRGARRAAGFVRARLVIAQRDTTRGVREPISSGAARRCYSPRAARAINSSASDGGDPAEFHGGFAP